MTKIEFMRKLEEAGLTQASFAKAIGFNRSTVSLWGADNSRNMVVPPWVESWLDNYVDAGHWRSLMRHQHTMQDILRP